MPGTRKLGRATEHRMAMLRAMVTFLLEKGKIETTVTRAKEVRSMAEKMITIAKKILLPISAWCMVLLQRKMLRTSCFLRLRRNTLTATAAIRALQNSDPAAGTQQKWRLSNFCNRFILFYRNPNALHMKCIRIF